MPGRSGCRIFFLWGGGGFLGQVRWLSYCEGVIAALTLSTSFLNYP